MKKSKSAFEGGVYGARAQRVLSGAAILFMSCAGLVLAAHGAGRFAFYPQLNTSPPPQDPGPGTPSPSKATGLLTHQRAARHLCYASCSCTPAAAAPPAPAPPADAPPPKSSDSKRVDLGKFVSVATTPVGLV